MALRFRLLGCFLGVWVRFGSVLRVWSSRVWGLTAYGLRVKGC